MSDPEQGEAKASSGSPWQGVEMPQGRPLSTDARADVCVVGAGIAGLTTAYLLGRKIVQRV